MILPGTYQNGFAPRDGEPLFPELWRGCVGAWNPGLGPSGARLFDWSTLKNHGTLNDMDPGTDWVASHGRYALDFDGTNDQVLAGSVGSFSFIQNTHRWAWAGWVRLSSLATAQAICGNTPLASGDRGFAVVYETGRGLGTNCIRTGVVRGSGSAAQTYQFRSPDNSFNSTGWNHVCVGMGGPGTSFIAINGKPSVTSLLTSDTTLSTGDSTRLLGIGYAPFTSILIPMQGQVDDVMIFNRLISPNLACMLASRRGIAYEMAPRGWTSQQIAAYRSRYYSQVIGSGVI